MEALTTSPFDADSIPKRSNLASTLFKSDCYSNTLNREKSSNSLIGNSTRQSTKSKKCNNQNINSLRKNLLKEFSFETNGIRKDIFGNKIEKGGRHKVSFRDDIKGQLLVEMTLVDIKESSLRSKNYKNYTIYREARDKERVLCSGVRIIF